MATSFNAKGMQPVREFPDNRNSSRLESWPICSGISPVSELLLRLRWVRSFNELNDDRMLPVRLSEDSSSFVTRLGVPPSVTPSQLVMAASTRQLRVPVPRSSSFRPSSSMQSRMRAGLSASSGAAPAHGAWMMLAIAVAGICEIKNAGLRIGHSVIFRWKDGPAGSRGTPRGIDPVLVSHGSLFLRKEGLGCEVRFI